MPTLTGHGLTRGRLWILALLALVLMAGHGVILYYASSHMAFSVAVVAGVALLVFIKHLGLFGAAFALLRKHWRKR